MRRVEQSFEELIGQLTEVETVWRDDFADEVIGILGQLQRQGLSRDTVQRQLATNFKAGMTVVRLFLDLSKDEFETRLRAQMGDRGIGVTHFRKHPQAFVDGLATMGLFSNAERIVARPVTWVDVLVERLKSGRGSAIKGQVRGRSLEDFTERIVEQVFGEGGYEARCRFLGESGTSTEKTDFAIPDRSAPQILIEAKAYGATGSKQTDVLGDITRIVDEKRHDTTFLLVTDGVTWSARSNDFRKLIDLQNRGRIQRIYTRKMAGELEDDLRELKRSLQL